MKHTVRNIVIENGQSTGSTSITLRHGEVVACAIYKSTTPSSPVDIKIEDSQGDELQPFMTYQDYEPGNGNYMESRKPLSIGDHKEIVVLAKSSEPLNSKVTFQIIFYIKKTNV